MVAIVPGQCEKSAGKEVNRDIRIAALNVGSMRSRGNEIVEMLSRRLLDICCVQIIYVVQDGGVSRLGKPQGEILTASFSGKGMIVLVEL